MKKIQWGIIGLGKIADKFCTGLLHTEHCQLYALASASTEKETLYRSKYQFGPFYPSYEELLADPKVDIIYIATPNHLHFAQSKQALLAGKHVLCEKPACLSPSQLSELQIIAKEMNCFFMEALWTIFLPGIRHIKQIITDHTYGKLLSVNANFGFVAQYSEDSRLFSPHMGGGSIYDIGIYPLLLALYCLGYPQGIEAEGKLAPTGCDISAEIRLTYPGAEALLKCSFEEQMPNDAVLVFEHARLRICPMWHTPAPIEITVEGSSSTEIWQIDCSGNGYECEADHAAQCILDGIIESPILTNDMSMQLAQMIESALLQIKR